MKLHTTFTGAKSLSVLLLFMLLSFSSQAQRVETNNARNLFWVMGGGGLSNLGGVAGLAGSHQFNSNILSVRFVRNYKIDGGGTAAWDVGALYGKSYKTRHAMISGSAGVAYVGPSEIGTVGLPLESQAFWTPTNYFGVGLYGFANINRNKSFAGVLLGVQLGRVNSAF